MLQTNSRILNVASLDCNAVDTGGCKELTISGYARPEGQATTMAITINIEDMADDAYSSKPSQQRMRKTKDASPRLSNGEGTHEH